MLIEVKNLSKSFQNAGKVTFALQNVSLDVEEGDVFGIIGLSGAGKSTLIRALAKLVVPSSGTILFRGQDITSLTGRSLRAFRQKIGMIFQHFNLLTSRTVFENIAYPLEIAGVPLLERQQRVDRLLALVNLSDKKEAYPAQLSGGQKQRVGIARALANQPEILLCDEATSALDPKSTREILTLLKEINQKLKVTIVLITHEMDVVKQICNKVAVIDRGAIIEYGPIAELFGDPQQLITKQLLQHASHEIPAEFFAHLSSEKKLLRLTFKGSVANEPLMSEIARRFDVNTNILSGSIDRLQTVTLGTLVIELTGSEQNIASTLQYLKDKQVHYELLNSK